ncbi:MAG: tetratricopeptide repeat protein, partial [Alphaproteobacteria bacterium]|nr:tetratricopeptide repeat protein [Alphaproteobacteria bacterium]
MSPNKAKWLLAGLMWLIVWPGVSHAQSPDLMDAFNRYSELYDQGHYREAIPYAEKALKLGEQEFGPDHPATASMLNNVAELHGIQGRYAKAEPLYKRALAIREKALRPEHSDVASSLDNLGTLYMLQGRFNEAEMSFEKG